MKKLRVFLLVFFSVSCLDLLAQTRSKEIKHQYQGWMSINSNIHLQGKWSVLADIHLRRNDFLASPGFYFVRMGAQYSFTKQFSVAGGYAHMWVAPSTAGWKTYAQENRIYQQLQYQHTAGTWKLLHRLRTEQRWQQKIVEDTYNGQNRFTNRIRYLLSLTIPLFKNEYLPSLVLADELHVQFGKEVIYNTFDQNRYFIGFRQTLTHQWSFDIGYMKQYQRKYSGYQYDSNDNFRLFFYFNGSLSKR